MKHLENNAYETERLCEALELPEVPKAVDQKLRQLYAELPEEVPAGRRTRSSGRALRRLSYGASALAAAFLLLFGANAVNPAFAESLPVVGSVFRRFNSTASFINEKEAYSQVADNAQALDGKAVTVAANGVFEKPLTVKAEEVYFDGRYVYAALSMDVGAEDDVLWNEYGEPCEGSVDILINGESQWDDQYGLVRNEDGFAYLGLNIGGQWEKEGPGHYLTTQSFRVPDKYLGAESLDVSFHYGKLLGEDNFRVVNSTPFSVDLTVHSTGETVRAIDCAGLEMGSVKLLSAIATTVGTEITLEVPKEQINPATGALFEDGRQLGCFGDTKEIVQEDGSRVYTRIFAGLKEAETRKVVFSVYDKNGTGDYAAVFVLDFAEGTVQTGTAEDVVIFPNIQYHCGWDDLEHCTDSHKITLASLKDCGNYLGLYIATTDKDPRDLRVTVSQDGQQIAAKTLAKEYSPKDRFTGYTYWEDGPDGEPVYYVTDRNVYRWSSTGMEELDPFRPAEIRIYDGGTGELLNEETITLAE